MSEGEPVGSVSQERVVEVGVEESGVNSCDPNGDGVRKNGMGLEDVCQPVGFLLERKGGEAAEDEADEKEREPEADRAEELRLGLELGCHVLAMVAQSDFEEVESRGLCRAKMRRNILNTW